MPISPADYSYVGPRTITISSGTLRALYRRRRRLDRAIQSLELLHRSQVERCGVWASHRDLVNLLATAAPGRTFANIPRKPVGSQRSNGRGSNLPRVA